MNTHPYITNEHTGRYAVVLIMLANANVANAFGSASWGEEATYYSMLDSLMGW